MKSVRTHKPGFRVVKKYQNGGVVSDNGPKISQGRDRSYTDMGVDILRALSQPLNYMREVGKGNYVPTQAELEGSGSSPFQSVVALANPFDHIYATLAMAGVIDDPNYDNEYSSAALLGLVTGSAGQKVPKALEKTVKLLREEGALTYGDIKSVLQKNKDNAVIKDLKAIKNKAIEFSKHASGITKKAYDDVVRKTGIDPSGYGRPARIESAATNYMIESDPDVLLNFTPEKFDAGDFDKSMQNFAEEYLTSFRSVRASDSDDAVKFLTDPVGTGRGGKNLGPGLYQGTKTALLGSLDPTSRPRYGDHLGVLRIAPEIGGPRASASEIIKNIQIGELKGGVRDDYMTRMAMHNARLFPGFTTNPSMRVSRSGTGVNLLDYSSIPEGRSELFDKYISDYYGASPVPYSPRGRDLLPDFNQGGKIKVKKKDQEGMRVKKRLEEGGSMGDPKRDKLDPKQDFIRRAQAITGRQLAILPQLEGLDYEKLQGMSDDEMQSLLTLVQSVAPKDRGDVTGGISNVMGNLGEIKDVISGLRENYDLDTKMLLDSIISAKDLGFVKAGLIRGAAKTAGLYRRGGRVRVIKNK